MCLHQVGTGHPSGPTSPPQVSSLSLHVTGSVGAGGHFCPITRGKTIQTRNNFILNRYAAFVSKDKRKRCNKLLTYTAINVTNN